MQHKVTENERIFLNALADTIKEEREKLNKSQRLLADEYELQRSLFCRTEKGLNEPKLFSLLSICYALNMRPSTFFAKIEEKLPQDFSLFD